MSKLSARIVELEHLIRQELQGFQLAREMKETVFGAIDLPVFKLRFRVNEGNPVEDQGWRVVIIPNKDKLDSEQLFIILAEQGYIHYLRHRVSSYYFLSTLERKERWRKLLQYVIESEKEDKVSPYKIKYCKELLKKPLTMLLFENSGVFDWLT